MKWWQHVFVWGQNPWSIAQTENALQFVRKNMEIPQKKEEDPVDIVLFLALALVLSIAIHRRLHLNFINARKKNNDCLNCASNNISLHIIKEKNDEFLKFQYDCTLEKNLLEYLHLSFYNCKMLFCLSWFFNLLC